MASAEFVYNVQPQWETSNEIGTHQWLPYNAKLGGQRGNRTMNVKTAICLQAQAKRSGHFECNTNGGCHRRPR